jgi:hypothetical protein
LLAARDLGSGFEMATWLEKVRPLPLRRKVGLAVDYAIAVTMIALGIAAGCYGFYLCMTTDPF